MQSARRERSALITLFGAGGRLMSRVLMRRLSRKQTETGGRIDNFLNMSTGTTGSFGIQIVGPAEVR